MNSLKTFFTEIRRRKVWLVGGIYIIAAWIIIQVISLIEEPLSLPGWFDTAVIVLAIAGLPLAIILAWAQESQAGDKPKEVPASDTDRPSIAVLPLTSIAGDADQEALADGMTEDIITMLSRTPELFVIARNSTFAYKGQSPDIRQVGKDLGARYVLEGSIRQIGANLRITVQLIEASDGTHIWAENFDSPAAQIFELQDNVTAGIVAQLRPELETAEADRAGLIRPESLEVWAMINRGKVALLNEATPERMAKSIALAREVIEREPDYGPAHTLLSWALGAHHATENEPNPSLMEEAVAAGSRGVELNPRDPWALYTLSQAYLLVPSLHEALECAQRGRRHDPNDPMLLTIEALALVRLGRPAEALPLLDQAFSLSPRDHYRNAWHLTRSEAYAGLGDMEGCLSECKECVALGRGIHWAWAWLAATEVAMGDEEAAKKSMREALRLNPTRAARSYLVYGHADSDPRLTDENAATVQRLAAEIEAEGA